MVPMDKTLQDFGADVQWDDYAQMFTIAKDGAFVKVKPGAKTAIVNGNPQAAGAGGDERQKAFISDTFINDVFQSGLDQTFQVEKRPHPLNALSADEIKQAVEIVKASADFKPNTRFTQIALAEPEKPKCGTLCLTVRQWMPPPGEVVMLDGKHVIESLVDLKDKKSCAGSRSKTRTAWCCWMISPRYSRSSTTARNLPRCLKSTASPTRRK
jgi:primary-amine oxidase